jgi:serine protease
VVYGDDPDPNKTPTPTPTPTPDPDLVVLENGVAESGLESEAGIQWLFAIDVPAGATELSFTMVNGTGDADLYVRFGTEPTDSKYDCRPYKQGKDEVCEFEEVQEGRYYAVIDAYKAFSDTSLVASYKEGTPTPTPTPNPDLVMLENGVTESGLESEAGVQWLFAIDVPAGATELSFTMANGKGDADLYVRFGTEPTDSKYDCRPYKQGKDEVCEFDEVQEGRYYAVIDAYKAFSDTSLVASYNDGTPTPTPTSTPTPTPTSTPTPTPTAEPEACPYPGAGSSWEEIIEWMRCKNRRMS